MQRAAPLDCSARSSAVVRGGCACLRLRLGYNIVCQPYEGSEEAVATMEEEEEVPARSSIAIAATRARRGRRGSSWLSRGDE
jgi:hypothetical protein